MSPKVHPQLPKNRFCPKGEILRKPQYLLCSSDIERSPGDPFSGAKPRGRPLHDTVGNFCGPKTQKVQNLGPQGVPGEAQNPQKTMKNEVVPTRRPPGHHKTPAGSQLVLKMRPRARKRDPRAAEKGPKRTSIPPWPARTGRRRKRTKRSKTTTPPCPNDKKYENTYKKRRNTDRKL